MPDDPGSYWYFGQKKMSILERLSIVPGVTAMDNPTKTGDKYTVTNNFGDAFNGKAALMKTALDEAYEKYRLLGMKEPKDWVAVYIHDLSASGDMGEEMFGMSNGTSRCVILIDKKNEGNVLKSVVAHELFHCFQEYIPLKSYTNEKWMWESTAVWAEEFVYPTHDTEHVYADYMFSTLGSDLLDDSQGRDYSSYLWWFYVYQKDGKTGTAVKTALDDAGSKGMKQALKDRKGIYDEIKEYALWNLNNDPFRYYSDAGKFPDKQPLMDTNLLVGDDQKTVNVNMGAGGMIYNHYFLHSSIDKIKFDLSTTNKNIDPGIGVQIVYRIGKTWFYEDVSDREELVFCRTRPPEKVDEIYLIVSNSDLDSSINTDFRIDTSGKCKPEWSGFTMYQWDHSFSKSVSDQVISKEQSAFASFSDRGYMISRDTLIYDDEADRFILKDQRITYRYETSTSVDYGRGCSFIWERDSSSTWGSDFIKYDDEDSAPIRMVVSKDDPLAYDVREHALKDPKNFLNYKSYAGWYKVPCDPFDGMQSGPPILYEQKDQSMVSGYGEGFNHDITANMSSDGKRISGSGTGMRVIDDLNIPVDIVVDYYYG